MSADLRNLYNADDPQPLHSHKNFELEEEDGLNEDSNNNIGVLTTNIK